MDTLVDRCCGMDVHKDSVVVTVLIRVGTRSQKTTRSFGTMTANLIELADWLGQLGVTHVGMESTASYWKPVHKILRRNGRFTLIVGNAQHIKNVPGRKTDVKDSEWIAMLVQHGLIRASFVPNDEVIALRDTTRLRRRLVQSLASDKNRLLVTLEECNVKLSSVATDAFGVSGMAMMRAIIAGDRTPSELAQLAKGRLKSKIPELELALDGRIAAYQRELLALQLDRIDATEAQITKLDKIIARQLAPHERFVELLDGIPGVDRTVAAELLAEMGTDMSVFHSVKHLCAWAGMAPGSYESAGKSKGSRTRRGNVHIKTALTQAAISAAKKKDCHLADKYHRLKARRGGKRAAVAMGRKILVIAYHILQTGSSYVELGAAYIDNLDRQRVTNNLVRRLERLGYRVDISEMQAERSQTLDL